MTCFPVLGHFPADLMRAYRAYLLDEQDLVVRAKVIEARSDEEAARIATAWAAGGRLELWTGSRAIAAAASNSGS